MAFGTEPAENHRDSASSNGGGTDLRNTISGLTHRLANLGKHATDGSDRNMGIFLAGANKGAVMKADEGTEKDIGHEMLDAYTNSNYQSVNNSIVIDGNCHAEDPGIHIEIVDYVEDVDIEEEEEDIEHHHEKEKKKKKKKDDGDDDDEDEEEDDPREKEGKKEKKGKKGKYYGGKEDQFAAKS